jgi:hypothetical protein
LPDDADVWHWHLLLLGLEVHLPQGTSPTESPPHAPFTPTIDVGATLDDSSVVEPCTTSEACYALPSLDTIPADASPLLRPLSPPLCVTPAQMLRASILVV